MGGQDHLEKYRVGSLPTLIYIPDFITDSDQAHLLNRIYQAPISKWKSLKNRRLQNWGGVVHEKGLLPQDLPIWLTEITQKICERTGLFPSPINHVLINEYLPDQGIMPHQDGPAYFPVVAILSLGSSAVMNFTPHLRLKDHVNCTTNVAKNSSSDKGAMEIGTEEQLKDKTNNSLDINNHLSVLLMPCSLLIFKDIAYSDYLHGIEDSNIHSLNGKLEEPDQPLPISGLCWNQFILSIILSIFARGPLMVWLVVNIEEVLKHQEQSSVMSLEDASETNIAEEHIRRTSTRVSLTCRLVLKVQRNLFKF